MERVKVGATQAGRTHGLRSRQLCILSADMVPYDKLPVQQLFLPVSYQFINPYRAHQ
jgi:hypothetical protein